MKQIKVERLETSFGEMGHVTSATENDSLVQPEFSQFRRRFVVLLASMTLILEGVNLSLPGPFFPDEAKTKGLTQTQIGLVVGVFDLANVAFSFVVASIVSPKNIKFFYSAGMLWSSITVGAFGVLSEGPDGDIYFYNCLLTRVVNGIGAAMLYSTAMPIAVAMYPDKAGVITSIIQTSLGLGLCMGPPVGSALLPLGGYKIPFLVVSSVEFVVFVLGLLFVPSKGAKAKTKINVTDYFKYLNSFSTLSVVIPTAFVFCIPGIRDTAYALYFEETLNLDSETVGYIFIAQSGAFLIAGPLIGILVEQGMGTYVALICQLTVPLFMFAFFLPSLVPALETIPWGLAILCSNGITVAALMNPSYLILEKVAIKQGYTNMQQVKTLVASSYNLIASSGRAIGCFVVGGWLNDQQGFYTMMLCYCIILSATGLWNCLFLFKSKLIRKVFYDSSFGAKALEKSVKIRMDTDTEDDSGDSLLKPTIADLLLSSLSRSNFVGNA